MSDIEDLIKIVNGKFQACFELLSPHSSGCRDHMHTGYFDYDPLMNAFLDVFLPVATDKNLHISYLDITANKIVKDMVLNVREPSFETTLTSFRFDHWELHDCQIEGSYFLRGDSGKWLVFYDAQSDFGVLLCEDEIVITTMMDFIIQR